VLFYPWIRIREEFFQLLDPAPFFGKTSRIRNTGRNIKLKIRLALTSSILFTPKFTKHSGVFCEVVTSTFVEYRGLYTGIF
jgi:hypothetical protein